MLDGILFTGLLSFKRNQDLQQWTRLRVVIRMNMVCTAEFLNMFDVYCLHTNLANTFRISFLSKNSDLSSMLEA